MSGGPWAWAQFAPGLKREDLGDRPVYEPPRDAAGGFMLSSTSGRVAKPPVPEGPHPGVYCDACKRMMGNAIRYTCLNCADFDLCQECEADGVVRLQHAGGMHVFAKIRSTVALGGEEAIARFRK